MKTKDLIDGCIVGTGTDYVVIQKERKRYLIEIMPNTIKELKNASTPYGSQIDWLFVDFHLHVTLIKNE